MYRRSALLSALAVALFAVCHSALASLTLKRRVRALVGERTSDGLYRFGFCAVAVLSFGAVLASIWRLPDRILYRVRGVPRLAMALGQLLCVAALIDTNWQNGFLRVTGIRNAWEYVSGRRIDRPPVAQHPLPEGPCMRGWTRPFRVSSHPNNFFVLLLYWLSPVMSVKFVAIGLVTAVYMVLGSLHEEQRLLHAYGARYACYRSHVPEPLLLPVHLIGRLAGEIEGAFRGSAGRGLLRLGDH